MNREDELKVEQVIDALDGKSRMWIEEFATRIHQSYDDLMIAADKWIQTGDYTYDNTESYKDHWDQFPEFWEHYEKVVGKQVLVEKDSFFSCSC